MLLKDKVVIISGIGPGLGVKLAIEAAREGAKAVAIGARSADKLDDAEKRIAEMIALDPGSAAGVAARSGGEGAGRRVRRWWRRWASCPWRWPSTTLKKSSSFRETR